MRKIVESMLVGSALLFAGTANAAIGDTYTMTPQDGSVFGTPSWSESAIITLDGNTSWVQAGMFRFHLDDGAGGGFDIGTFCIEIAQSLSLPATYTEAAFDTSTVDDVNALWSNAYSLVTDASSAAAFQLSLWELTHDTGYDLGAGALSVAADAVTMAQADLWLEQVATRTWTPDENVLITALKSETSQDQLHANRRIAVPVPATGILMVGAGAAMYWQLRRRRA